MKDLFIYKKEGYYYYLGSTGTCCEGEKSTYQVKVARSATFKGPYIDKEGKPLLENGGTLLLQKDAGTELTIDGLHIKVCPLNVADLATLTW